MSTANYIIICKGKIDYATANTPAEKARAISNVAEQLVSHIDLAHPNELTPADTQPVSDLQHSIMDNWRGMSPQELDASAAQMFTLLDALEDKFET